jgi:hypothetical protein
MTQESVAERVVANDARRLSLIQRIVGVIFSPKPTYESIAAWPRWLDVLIVTTLVTCVAFYWFLSTEVGQNAFLDQQISGAEAWGRPMNDEAIRGMERSLPFMRYITVASILVIGPIMALATAGILFAVFTAIMGGQATYKQALAIVTHAGVVPTFAGLLVLPLNYVRQSMTSATNLAVFVPGISEDSFLGAFLGAIDVIWIWWTIILAIGMAVLYRRKPGAVIQGFLGVYLLIAIVIAGVKTAFGGS